MRQRDWFFSAIFVVVIVMLFQIAAPSTSGDAISQWVSKLLGLQGNLDITFVTSVIWFLLLGFVFRYLQVTIHIERQYTYMHRMEDILSSHYNGETFTREGKSYLERYPLFSDWAHILYRRVFPILLVAVGAAKLASEWPGFAWPGVVAWGFIFDVLMYVFIVISIALYMEVLPIVRTIDVRRAPPAGFVIGIFQRIVPSSRPRRPKDPEDLTAETP